MDTSSLLAGIFIGATGMFAIMIGIARLAVHAKNERGNSNE